jgi:hypothetical protein
MVHLMYIMFVKKAKNPESIIKAELPGQFLKKSSKKKLKKVAKRQKRQNKSSKFFKS